MITDAAERYVVSNLGWADHGSVWVFDAETRNQRHADLSQGEFVIVGGGTGELFSAVHHFRGRRLVVTAHSFEEPEAPLAQVDIPGWRARSSGDPTVWQELPSAYVGHLDDSATGAAGYFVVSREAEEWTVSRLDWFDDSYDWGYQSVIAVAVVPETGELLYGVQRSSDLVLCAAGSGEVVRKVRLSGHLGNPEPYCRRSEPEVWAVDYDTVVRVDRRTWRVTGDKRGSRSGMFLGDLSWPPDERHVSLARPGFGDVLVLDPASLRVRRRIKTGREPLEAVVLPSGLVVARDWKTGDVLLVEQAP